MKDWNFEHDEFECDECSTPNNTYQLNFYLGVFNGEYAHMYRCTNKECNFVEIKTIAELYADEKIEEE